MALKVLVTYVIKPGHREAFLEGVGALRPAVLAEEGCLQYEFFRSVTDENKAVLVEEWVDRDAQKVHQTQPHMDTFRADKGEHVIDTIPEFYDI